MINKESFDKDYEIEFEVNPFSLGEEIIKNQQEKWINNKIINYLYKF